MQGLRNAILTATKGTAVLNTNFLEYAAWAGDLSMREFGSLTAFETGQSSTYALTRCANVYLVLALRQLHCLRIQRISRAHKCTCLALSMRMVPLSWLLPVSRSIEARGRLFIKPGQDIYEGQVIGIHQRAGDLAVNACKRKAATNIRRCSRGPHG